MYTGCSHNRIVNIIEKYREINTDGKLACVIGGFHLFNPTSRKYEKDDLIVSIAKELKTVDSKFYTCHCAGVNAYNKMKTEMKDKLEYLSVGMVVEL